MATLILRNFHLLQLFTASCQSFRNSSSSALLLLSNNPFPPSTEKEPFSKEGESPPMYINCMFALVLSL